MRLHNTSVDLMSEKRSISLIRSIEMLCKLISLFCVEVYWTLQEYLKNKNILRISSFKCSILSKTLC